MKSFRNKVIFHADSCLLDRRRRARSRASEQQGTAKESNALGSFEEEKGVVHKARGAMVGNRFVLQCCDAQRVCLLIVLVLFLRDANR